MPDDLQSLAQAIAADADAADAIAQKSAQEWGAKFSGAFIEGWRAGGVRQWLNLKAAQQQASEQAPPKPS